MHLMNIIALFINASIRELCMKFFSGCVLIFSLAGRFRYVLCALFELAVFSVALMFYLLFLGSGLVVIVAASI